MKIILVIIGAITLNGFFTVAQAEPSLTYEFKPTQKWSRDLITEQLSKGDEHYVLSTDKSIDLLFTFTDEKVFSEFNKLGEKAFINQLMKGKNLIQNLVSKDAIQLISSHVTEEKTFKVITLETAFLLNKEKYFTLEKYYIYPTSSLQAVLRWSFKSMSAELKSSKAEFSQFIVKEKQK